MLAFRAIYALLVLPGLLGASAAAAQGPQELEQLEPGRNKLQLEYQGLFRPLDDDAGSAHSVGASYRVSDRLALGLELEGVRSGARLNLETFALSALYRLTAPDDDSLGLGIKLSAGSDFGGKFTESEFRFIAERIGSGWWLQGNLMAQHESEDGYSTTSLTYVANASHTVASNVWLGLEASGDLTRVAGNGEFAKGQFIGPSACVEVEFGEDRELEIGVVYSARVAGQGPANSLRMFAQLEF